MATRPSSCKTQVTKAIKRIQELSEKANEFFRETNRVFSIQDHREMATISVHLKIAYEIIEKYLEKWQKLEEFDDTEYDQYLDDNNVLDILESVNYIRSELDLETARFTHLSLESSMESSNLNVQPAQPKLKPFEIPTFNGNPTKWPEFRDLFLAMVDSQSISAVQKFCYLKESLSGDALNVIDGFSLTNSSYTSAWDLLKKRYDRKGELKANLLSKLDRLIPSTNCSNTRKLINQINIILRQFKDNGISHDNETILYRIQVLLPTWLLKKIHEKVDNPEELTTARILELADTIISKEEYVSVFQSSRNEPSPKQIQNDLFKPINNHEGEDKIDSSTNCIFCHQSHSDENCVEYPDKESRTHRAFQLRLCFRCLSKDHKSTQCRSWIKCSECNESHNKLFICNTFAKMFSNSKQVHYEKSPASNTNLIPLKNNNICTLAIEEKSQFVGTTTFSSSIPLQASIGISANPGQSMTRSVAMLDTGSEVNIITTALAKQLNLDLRPSKTKLCGVNEQRISAQIFETLAYIQSKKGKPLPIKLLVLDSITTPMAFFQKFPKSLEQAQNWSFEVELQRPDLLLGLNVFHEIAVKFPGKILSNGLTISDSNAGVWISGKLLLGNVQETDSKSLMITEGKPCQDNLLIKTQQEVKVKKARVRYFYNSNFCHKKNLPDSNSKEITNVKSNAKIKESFDNQSKRILLSRPEGPTCRVFYPSNPNKREEIKKLFPSTQPIFQAVKPNHNSRHFFLDIRSV